MAIHVSVICAFCQVEKLHEIFWKLFNFVLTGCEIFLNAKIWQYIFEDRNKIYQSASIFSLINLSFTCKQNEIFNRLTKSSNSRNWLANYITLLCEWKPVIPAIALVCNTAGSCGYWGQCHVKAISWPCGKKIISCQTKLSVWWMWTIILTFGLWTQSSNWKALAVACNCNPTKW